MATIDERVVKMRFDNAGFKSGISDTISLLDRFKKKLNLSGASKGIDDVQSSVNKFNLNPLTAGVSAAENSFNALRTVAVGAFLSIGAKAAETGMQLANSLTLKPAMEGFQEYELKMGSIQTILANTQSKGTGLEDVKASLSELNTYADKTIYNFGDMTRNIGLFTNAGLGIEESTSMIKGFSNAAAASGTNATAAAGAAYQLSQGLSSGYLTAMDWMSLTNAGMGNKNMQTDLIAIADAMGTFENGSSSAEEATKDFKNTLADGKWLTKDVMSTYLQAMAGDLDAAALKAKGLSDETIKSIMLNAKTGEEAATKIRTLSQLTGTIQEEIGSGWSETWELIFGDFEEATELFSGIHDALSPLIEGTSKFRNEVLKAFADIGGRKALFDGIGESFRFIGELLKPVGQAFSEVFGRGRDAQDFAQQLKNLSVTFRDFAKGLSVSSETADKIKRTFKGLFAVFSIAGQIIGAVVKAIFGLVGATAGASGGFLSVTASIGDFLVKIDEGLRSSDILNSILGGLGAILKGVGSAFAAVGRAMANFITGGEEGVNVFTRLKDAASSVLDFLSGFGERISGALQNGTQNLGEFPWAKILGVGSLVGIFASIRKIMKNGLNVNVVTGVFDSLKDTLGAAKESFEGVTGIFDSVTKSLDAMQQSLKADVLLKIAAAVGILALSLIALAGVPAGDLAKASVAIGVLTAELVGAMQLLTMINPKNVMMVQSLATAMVAVATAVLILSSAVKKLAELSWGELLRGLAGVAASMGILAGGLRLMPDKSGMVRMGTGLILVATALNVMVSAVRSMSDLSWGEMAQGLIGVGGALVILAGGLRLMPKEQMMSTGAGLIMVGAGLKVVASAVQSFGSMDLSDLVQGILGIGGALVVLSGALRLIPNNMMATGAGLVVVGAGLQVIAEAVVKLGSLDVASLVKGLAGIGGSLVIIAGAMQIMPKNMLVTAAGLLMVASALSTISKAVISMGGMSWEGIAKGLVALGGSLGILAAGLYAMSGALAGAAALTVASVGISMLAGAVMKLSTLDLGGIFKALGTLAGVIGVIGVASLALTPAIPALMGLGGALILIGASVMAAGAGMALFASSLSLLAGPASAGVQVLQQMFELIPDLLTALAEGITQFITTLAANGEQIIGAVTSLISTLLTNLMSVIVTVAPQIGQAFTAIVTEFLQTIITLTPTIVQAIVTLVVNMLQGIQTIAPQFAETFVTIMKSILGAINQVAPDVINTIVNLIFTLVDTIVSNVPRFVEAAIQLVTGLINGIASQIGAVIQSAVNLVLSFAEGIASQIPVVVDRGYKMAIELIHGVANAIRSNSAEVGAAGADLGMAIIQGIAGAIRAGVSTVISAAADMAGSALAAAKNKLGIHSPSREFYKVGDYSVQGIAKGIKDKTVDAVKSAKTMSGRVLNAAAEGFKGLGDAVSDNAPTVADEFGKMTDRVISDTERIKNATGEFKDAMSVGSGGLAVAMAPTEKRGRFSLHQVLDTMNSVTGVISDGLELYDKAADVFGLTKLDGTKGGQNNNPADINYDGANPSINADGTVRKAEGVGENITKGVDRGAKRGWPAVVENFQRGAQDMLKRFKEFFGIHSPSRVMMDMGSYIVEGLTVGISNEEKSLRSSANHMSKTVFDTFDDIDRRIEKSPFANSPVSDFFDNMSGRAKFFEGQAHGFLDDLSDRAKFFIGETSGFFDNITGRAKFFERRTSDLFNYISGKVKTLERQTSGFFGYISGKAKFFERQASDLFGYITGKAKFFEGQALGLFGYISGKAKSLKKQAYGFLDEVRNAISEKIKPLKRIAEDPVGYISGQVKALKRRASELFDYVSGKAKSFKDQAAGFIDDVRKDIFRRAKDLESQAVKSVAGFFGSLAGRAKALKSQVFSFLDDTARKIKSLDGRAAKFVDNFFDNISVRVKSLKKQTYEFFDNLRYSAKSLGIQVAAIFNDISDKSQTLKVQILDFFASIPGRVRTLGRQVNSALSDFERDMTARLDNLKSTILSLPTPSQVMTEMSASVIRGLRQGIAREENLLLSSVDSMTTVIFAALDDIEKRLDNSPLAGTPVAAFFHDVSAQTKSFMKDLPGAISSMADKLNGRVDGLDSFFDKMIESARALDPVHDRILKMFDQGLSGAQKSLSSSVGSMSKTLSDAFDDIEKRIEDSPLSHPPVDGFFDGISDKAKFFAGEVPGTLTSIVDRVGDKDKIWGPAFFGLESALGNAHDNTQGIVTEIEKAYHDLFDVDKVFEDIKADIDYISNPVIKPIVDLSQVDDINDIFGSASNVRSGALATMSRFNKTQNAINDSKANAGQPSIQFTQNNHSPKALSLDDIYRKTNNQLNFFKLRGGGFNP
nr:MAG TPA: tail tape measure [Caudoviricetes sp.]